MRASWRRPSTSTSSRLSPIRLQVNPRAAEYCAMAARTSGTTTPTWYMSRPAGGFPNQLTAVPPQRRVHAETPRAAPAGPPRSTSVDSVTTVHPVPASPATPSPPRRPPAPAPPPFSMHHTFLIAQPEGTELALVRHGQQQFPTSPVFIPAEWVAPPLSEVGRRQAELVGKSFAERRVDVVVSSHLSRARETASAIAAHHDLEPIVLEDLREVEVYRDLEDGASPADALAEPFWRGVQERFPTERRWDLVPFGESSGELRHRVVSTIEGLLAMHPEANLVVVCHGGVINAYLAHLLGIAEDMFFLPAHTSVSRVRRLGPRRALHSLNDRDHVAGADPGLLTY